MIIYFLTIRSKKLWFSGHPNSPVFAFFSKIQNFRFCSLILGVRQILWHHCWSSMLLFSEKNPNHLRAHGVSVICYLLSDSNYQLLLITYCISVINYRLSVISWYVGIAYPGIAYPLLKYPLFRHRNKVPTKLANMEYNTYTKLYTSKQNKATVE